jgi:hypothetical protein
MKLSGARGGEAFFAGPLKLSSSPLDSCQGAVRAKLTNLMDKRAGARQPRAHQAGVSWLMLKRRAKCQIGLPFQTFLPPACRVSATLGGSKWPNSWAPTKNLDQ